MNKFVIDDLREGMISDQTICNERGMVLVARGIPLTHSVINRLRKFNISIIAIQEEADSLKTCSETTPVARHALSSIEAIADHVFKSRTVNAKNNIEDIEQVMREILKRPFIQEYLIRCAADEQLYQHSLRTAILSVNMGLMQKWNPVNLEYLAMCAVLHDYGMDCHYDEDNRQHPFAGFVQLRENNEIDMLMALVCLQHHEHYDGSGYPYGFKRSQITDFACLISMVDYYERLLMKSENPRKAMFETIAKKNTLFDPHMAELFSDTIDWSRLYAVT